MYGNEEKGDKSLAYTILRIQTAPLKPAEQYHCHKTSRGLGQDRQDWFWLIRERPIFRVQSPGAPSRSRPADTMMKTTREARRGSQTPQIPTISLDRSIVSPDLALTTRQSPKTRIMTATNGHGLQRCTDAAGYTKGSEGQNTMGEKGPRNAKRHPNIA